MRIFTPTLVFGKAHTGGISATRGASIGLVLTMRQETLCTKLVKLLTWMLIMKPLDCTRKLENA